MSSNLIIQNLNAQQAEAVEHFNGPLLVFAGAGSGKTRVITNRIANLIYKYKIDPSQILAVTFTKKASEEMKSRVTDLLRSMGSDMRKTPLIGTFHSIAALFLRKHGHNVGLDTSFTILDSDDSENLIKEILIDFNYDPKKFRPSTILHMVEDAKNNLVSWEDYSYNYGGYVEDIVAQVYEEYSKRLEKMNAVDFGDLLFKAVKMLRSDKNLLIKYQELYPYILVDEYQDTNKAQYEFIKLLAGDLQNLCVVGDDDQGIYKWRGADIKNIINFQKDFSSVKVIKLEQNYRSTSNIINAATSVIQKNFDRVDKTLWTSQEEGEKINVYQAEDEVDEANFVIEEILELNNQGKSLNNFAILYRTNYQSRAIEEALLKRGLPYKLVGGFRFYDRKEIKDLVSYLRFIANPKDYLSLLRIINVPSRKIGAKAISELASIAREAETSVGEMLLITYWLNHSDLKIDILNEELVPKVEKVKEKLKPFDRVVNLFGLIFFENQGKAVKDIIQDIIFRISYLEYINDGTDMGQSKVENVEELKNVASTYGEASNSLQSFLEGIALIESEQDKNETLNGNGQRITLMTLHASKGLEFPIVFIVGMEEGLLPHSRSFTDTEDLEEERRLCYVGITRARERLYLTFAEARMTGTGGSPFGRIPSRFLGEIPQDICDYYSWNN